jgi:hypothetical protein
MEDIAPADPNGTIGVTAVTNQFSVLSTVEDQLTAAEPLTKGSEEKSETPEEKKARNQKDNSDRSRLKKATVKKGAQLERDLTKRLVTAKYNREAISVNLEKMKGTLFSLQWNEHTRCAGRTTEVDRAPPGNGLGINQWNNGCGR